MPVKIIISKINVAVVNPALEQLPPLREYRSLVLKEINVSQFNTKAVGDIRGLCSVIAAGLVPRFQAALEAAGYKAAVDDQRSRGDQLDVDQELCRETHGYYKDLVVGAIADPLLVAEFRRPYDLLWRVFYLCQVFPRARTLIVAAGDGADLLCCEAEPLLGDSLGLYTRKNVGNRRARCLITTYTLLPKVWHGNWQVVILIHLRSDTLTEAFYLHVVNLRAKRIYSLVATDMRLGKATRLRLEAMSGSRCISITEPSTYQIMKDLESQRGRR